MGWLHPDAQKYKRRSVDARVSLGASLVKHPESGGFEFGGGRIECDRKESMTEILCLMNMMKECGRDPKGQILTDSSAANGIVHRQGCGKVKHLECRSKGLLEKASSATPRQQSSPAYTMAAATTCVMFDTTVLVDSRCSSSLDEFAALVYNRVGQKMFDAEETTQNTVEIHRLELHVDQYRPSR